MSKETLVGTSAVAAIEADPAKSKKTYFERLHETLGDKADALAGREMVMESASPFVEIYHQTSRVHPMAFVREQVQNELENGATHVKVGIDKQLFLERGIARFTCGGNGTGLDPKYQTENLLKLGKTGLKTNAAGKNHGWGGRTSLHWSGSGIEYHSWQGGVGTRVLVGKDLNQKWRYIKFPAQDGEAPQVAMPASEELRKEFGIEEHGTVVVAHGAHEDSNSFEGEYEQAGLYAHVKFLNVRYFRAHSMVNNKNASVSMEAWRFNTSKTENRVKGNQLNGGYYKIWGAEHYWNGAARNKASVLLGNGVATMHVWDLCNPKKVLINGKEVDPKDPSYDPKDPSAVPPRCNWQSYMLQKGVFGIAFENEIYSGYYDQDADKHFSMFGASYSDLNENLAFVLEMHPGSCMANHQRNELTYLLTPGKKEIPLRELGMEFIKKIPTEVPFLDKLLRAKSKSLLSEDSGKIREELRELVKELEAIQKPVTLTSEEASKLAEGGFGVVPKRAPKKIPTGPHKKERRSKSKKPWPEEPTETSTGGWVATLSFEHFKSPSEGRGVVPANCSCRYIQSESKVQIVNWDPIPKALIEQLFKKYKHYPQAEDRCLKAFRDALERDLGGRLVIARWNQVAHKLSDADYDQAISDAALSTFSWVLIRRAAIHSLRNEFKNDKLTDAKLNPNVAPY